MIILIALILASIIILVYINKKAEGNDVEPIGISPTAAVTPVSTPTPTLLPISTPVPEATATPVPTNPAATPLPTMIPGPIPENLEALREDLERYISGQEGKYGLYFMNLITGEEFGIHDRDEYIAASTTKLPMTLLLYKKVSSGEVDLNSKLIYLEGDYEFGSGEIQDSPHGTEYTVRETARLSIVHSDNCGINMIIRLLGIDNIRKYMQELGGTVYYGSRHRSCPYDLALYARELYRFYQETPEVAGMLVEDLQNTEWNDRINKFLPEEVKVSHKIGTFPKVYNDVGIIFASEPYVLAVMSDDIEHSEASDVIAQISRRIYDFVER